MISTPTSVLALQNISKQFDRTKAPVLNQIEFELRSGEILGLLGPSGCGKTTLLRLIGGFESPDEGSIALAGQSIATAQECLPPEQRDIGMVFQDYALFPHLTIENNVAFGLKNNPRQRFAPQHISALTQEAIDRVGLTSLEKRYPHEISGGQQQRVALARALAPQPAMILLDEPLSNLDVQVRLRLRQEIRSVLKSAQTSAIFVTHDQEEALSICDRIAVMNAGKIEQLGTPEELYYKPRSRFVAEFITQANFIPAQWQDNRWQTEIGPVEEVQASDHQSELMIRPETLQLALDPNSPIVIRDRQFLGRDYRYELVLPSGQVIFSLRPIQERFEIGDRVNCKITD